MSKIICPPYRNTSLNHPPPWRPGPRTQVSTLSTGTCVKEGDLAMDMSAFNRVLLCISSVLSSSNHPGPHQLPPSLTSAFTFPNLHVVGHLPSLSHTGKAMNRRPGQKSSRIIETLTHREGDKGPKSALASSSVLMTAFPMTVSAPAVMDERSASCYSAAIPSLLSHIDACRGSFRLSIALPERGVSHLGHFCADAEGM